MNGSKECLHVDDQATRHEFEPIQIRETNLLDFSSTCDLLACMMRAQEINADLSHANWTHFMSGILPLAFGCSRQFAMRKVIKAEELACLLPL